jgi:hypothetical protein
MASDAGLAPLPRAQRPVSRNRSTVCALAVDLDTAQEHEALHAGASRLPREPTRRIHIGAAISSFDVNRRLAQHVCTACKVDKHINADQRRLGN